MLDPRIRRGGQRRPLGSGTIGGPDTGSGGGTTVRVGSANQTGYLLWGSLTMRLNTFDFRIKNPATVPVVGDMVYVQEPAWDGQIVSISWDDIPVGSDRFYSITATNAKVPTLAAAAIALSDTPDLSSTSYSNSVGILSPVGYWRFGEPSGTTATDEIAAHHHGVYVNTPTLGATSLLTGDADTAVTFNGTDEYVTVADSAMLDCFEGTNPWTFAVWLSHTPDANQRNILNITDEATSWVTISSENAYLMAWRHGAGGDDQLQVSPLSAGTHLLVVTYSGSALALYLDGALATGGTNPLASTRSLGAFTSKLHIGADGWFGGMGLTPPFNGTLDEPALWNRALSLAEVAALYTAGTTAPTTLPLDAFPYRDLRITYSSTDNGQATRGTLSIRKGEGLWPLQTFTLTSGHFGFVAQPFTCSNVTVTWPLDRFTRWFEVEFGDALLGLTELPVNTGGLSTNADGTTSLRDPLGNLIFNSATGFGSAWRRFLMSGVYNGDFAAGPPDPSIGIINVTNVLPSWTFLRIGGTGINATWVPDWQEGSGYVLRFTMSPGVADDEIVLEQLVPINASRNRAYAYRVRAYFFNGSASASPGGLVTLEHQFMRSDGSTTTGAPISTSGAVITATDLNTGYLPATNSVAPPADAYFIRIRVGFKRDTALVGTTASVDLAEVRLEGGIGTSLLIPDDIDPATNGLAWLFQSNKILNIVAGRGSGAAGTTYGTIQLGTTNLQIGASVLTTGGAGFPTSPAPTTDQQYYRTDLDMWFFYDGTRWLSTTLYHWEMMIDTTVGVELPVAATAITHRSANPLSGVLDLWIEKFQASFYVVAGTALSGSHKWDVVLSRSDGTTVSSYAINSGSSSVHRTTGQVAVAALIGTSNIMCYVTCTKTGTPGNLYLHPTLTYRIVAT